MIDVCAELNAYAIRIRDKLVDDLATSYLESLVQFGGY
jgi:hypothetical protein